MHLIEIDHNEIDNISSDSHNIIYCTWSASSQELSRLLIRMEMALSACLYWRYSMHMPV